MIETENITISHALLMMITELDEFKGNWDLFSRLPVDRLGALRRVASIESIGSSTRIEGSELSNSQVEALLGNLEIGSFRTRDEQEVGGYAKVMNMIYESYKHIPISENTIKQLHRDLLSFSEKDTRHRGKWKTNTNHVEAFDADGSSLGIIFKTATPFDTPRRMTELVNWINETIEQKEIHSLIAISIFTVIFLEIHPFQDGNGRLSRILTTLLMLKAGYQYVSYSSMESVIEKNKEQYYIALRRTQSTIGTPTPAWSHWIDFFFQSCLKQKNSLEEKMKREHIVMAKLPELSKNILDILKEHAPVSVSFISKLTGQSRNTVKDHLQKLVANQHIQMEGKGRGVQYRLK